MLVRKMPRQGVRVSRIGVKVDPLLRSGYFPVPNQSRIIGKKCPFAGDHLLHEKGRLGFVGSEVSNLGEIPVVVEHTAKITAFQAVKDTCSTSSSAFWRLAREIL